MSGYTAFIFARGGSKGLPGKNIRPLAGKPLIAWTIDQALAVSRISRVLVSTDSPEIAEIAIKHGAVVPFFRPEELSRDDSPEWFAWRHALRYLEKYEGEMPRTLLSLPTTSPMRTPQDVEHCLDHFETGNFDVVITVTEAHRNPYFNMVKFNPDDTVRLVTPPPENINRRQDVPPVFDLTTVAYVVSSKYVIEKEGLFSGRVGAVMIPRERSLDIDTLQDFNFAEYLMNEQLNSKCRFVNHNQSA